jgi:hypothetical protein
MRKQGIVVHYIQRLSAVALVKDSPETLGESCLNILVGCCFTNGGSFKKTSLLTYIKFVLRFGLFHNDQGDSLDQGG